ncbi:unnamed protein product [Pleuronectes platessa]|uniref:Uncharacterized protein n=1 Tax=Pleuronectes platessa TaxID=8262 RepID=A0A9N7UP99_PLEPL|nr:unnamed protein product [Pleuronectes platessa]
MIPTAATQLLIPRRTKHHSVAEETRPNSVPRARRIRSISGPSTKPLQQMNQRYPAQAMTSSPNSGDSLTACTPRNTTRDSLDFPKIRASRASNTAEVTAIMEYQERAKNTRSGRQTLQKRPRVTYGENLCRIRAGLLSVYVN